MKQTLLIPREIAEWIEYCKKNDFTLLGALDPIGDFGEPLANSFKGDVTECSKWAKRNSNDFAYAWVKGYGVKEKYYYIAIPCGEGKYRHVYVNGYNNLVVSNYTYSSVEEIKKLAKDYRVNITEKMIKDSDVAWCWQFAKELGYNYGKNMCT